MSMDVPLAVDGVVDGWSDGRMIEWYVVVCMDMSHSLDCKKFIVIFLLKHDTWLGWFWTEKQSTMGQLWNQQRICTPKRTVYLVNPPQMT